jgi:DNA-binding protein HU-beta
MTKQQLIEKVAAKTELEKADAAVAVDSVLDLIAETLRANERVDLRGFGSFVVKERKERQGRNPRTGETITIAAKRDASFKLGKELTEKLVQPETAPTPETDGIAVVLKDILRHQESAATIDVQTLANVIASLFGEFQFLDRKNRKEFLRRVVDHVVVKDGGISAIKLRIYAGQDGKEGIPFQALTRNSKPESRIYVGSQSHVREVVVKFDPPFRINAVA